LLNVAWARAKVDFNTMIVRDGEEAILLLEKIQKENHPHPSLLLLDLKMPKVDGFQVLSWVRSNPAWSKLPVFVLSSSAQPCDIERARLLGCNEYLVKPPTFDGLVACFRKLEGEI
jgi:CheY-like chemotaxis protein